MSIKLVYWTKCDSCNTTAFPRDTAKQTRYEAERCGWHIGKGKRGRDVCPECKEKDDGQTETKA